MEPNKIMVVWETHTGTSGTSGTPGASGASDTALLYFEGGVCTLACNASACSNDAGVEIHTSYATLPIAPRFTEST